MVLKLNDKVKIISQDFENTIGTIIRIHDNVDYKYEVAFNYESWCFKEKELIFIKKNSKLPSWF